MRFFFRKLNIGFTCTAKQVAPVNVGGNVLCNKISCFIAYILTKSVHILAVAVNGLYRTAQLVCNAFDQYFLHAALTGNFESSFNNHIFCYSLFWHCSTSV